ncbi:MAG: HEPN domain-containing protein [Paludibacter sp.]|nr:HEPN domain-containing protein [Paludibacter sp.]
MKPTTNEWINAANDDLLAAKTLGSNNRLTNLAAFHCQQFLEKSFKAIIEEFENFTFKSHDLFRLQMTTKIELTNYELQLLGTINEVYIDARYPGDMGLLPNGKPTLHEIDTFIQFCEDIQYKVKLRLIGS